jgi:hypothetical protein
MTAAPSARNRSRTSLRPKPRAGDSAIEAVVSGELGYPNLLFANPVPEKISSGSGVLLGRGGGIDGIDGIRVTGVGVFMGAVGIDGIIGLLIIGLGAGTGITGTVGGAKTGFATGGGGKTGLTNEGGNIAGGGALWAGGNIGCGGGGGSVGRGGGGSGGGGVLGV